MDSYFSRKNLHLIICVIIVIPAGFLYGTPHAFILPELMNVQTTSVDLKNILKALMALYFGIAAIWITGIIRPDFWKFATILVIVFMACLVLGRTISMVTDGKPSLFLILGLFGELVLCLFGCWQFYQYGRSSGNG
ncbi:DUF4345 domain-containing protein [Lutimonas saemankumensis]|uniref:DUF4345 domain-containing protein n=1 Tax=Lutimonas saemankumensis TaxID=483016 RepID=UPI001CD6DF92|nr:DUF4345 domain-containing protein [Lutimonas saemankumensis]MCA0931441.1 DUF4345 domain-containing protein [Lutimonas saemankumensis]